MNLDMDTVKDWFSDLGEKINDSIEQTVEYFQGLDQFQMIAWGAIGLGVILIIVSLFFW